MNNATATYTLHEVINTKSIRRGEVFTGTLTAAKRAASRIQQFKVTALVIRDDAGNAVSTKCAGKYWINHD
jgi:hypothetical protein